MKRNYDVVVVGGGVIGCSIAYHLSKSGVKVAVLEKQTIGCEASCAAAGILGAQAEIDEEGPLLEFALEGRERFKELAGELKSITGVDIELVQEGVLKTATTELEAITLQNKVKQHRRWDQNVSWLNQNDVLQYEPHLSPTLHGAMYIPNDGQIMPKKLVEAFHNGCIYYGVDFYEETNVQKLLISEYKAYGVEIEGEAIYGEKIVIATGAYANQFLKECSPSVNVFPVKGECLCVQSEKPLLSKTIFLEEGFYLVPKSNHRIFVGATKLPHVFQKKVSLGGVASLIAKAEQLLPSIKEASLIDYWAGLRPQTDDGYPYLGEHPTVKSLFMACGHFRNGILLSAITGEVMASLIKDNEMNPVYRQAFSIERLDQTVR
ncbi:glycine oxidase ThiO [Priestia koreensis]|uniref:glycine oxidase ThiO n=1 Tax=Priestia koreensis TaxID=284581 RepID=UPI0028F7048D|nr:glycine oxidase ThiO [Priestia koreensis]